MDDPQFVRFLLNRSYDIRVRPEIYIGYQAVRFVNGTVVFMAVSIA
jgi:hypothetical protein